MCGDTSLGIGISCCDGLLIGKTVSGVLSRIEFTLFVLYFIVVDTLLDNSFGPHISDIFRCDGSCSYTKHIDCIF